MRQEFFLQLFELMKTNPNIHLLVGDLGYIGADKIRDELPLQFTNCGASEQAMLDIAVGMAYEGKTVFVYTITPFFYRGFETIRTYIDHEKLDIKLCGSGRDKEYEHDGYSHDASDIEQVFKPLHNIICLFPRDKDMIKDVLKNVSSSKRPYFISLSKKL